MKFKETVVKGMALFGFACSIEGRGDQLGMGRTKKDAKADSAKQAFLAINNESYSEPGKKNIRFNHRFLVFNICSGPLCVVH